MTTDEDDSDPTRTETADERSPTREGEEYEPPTSTSTSTSTDGSDPDGGPTTDERADSDDPGGAPASGETDGPRAREVVVPMRLYKTVTVMATLIAMVGVVAGFVLLDFATNRAQADLSEIDPVVALLGLACIVGGAATYAYSTRFRAAGMGKSKSDETERSDNG